MQKKIAFLSFCVCFGSQAQELKPFLHLLKKTTPEVLICEEVRRDFSDCLQAVCGAPNTTKNHLDMMNDLSNAPRVPSEYDFEREIISYYDTKIAGTKKHLEGAPDLLLKDKTKIDPELAAYHKMVELFAVTTKISPKSFTTGLAIKDGEIEIEMDKNELANVLAKELGGKRAGHLLGPYVEFVKSEKYQRHVFGTQFGWGVSNDLLHPGKSVKEIVEATSKELKLSLAQLEKEKPKAFELLTVNNVVNDQLIEQISKGSNPSEELLDSYFRTYYMLSLMTDYLKGEKKEFNKFSPKSLTDIYPKEVALAAVNERLQVLNALSGTSPILQVNHQHCQAILDKTHMALPSAQERETFLKSIEDSKKQFKNTIFGKISSDSARTLTPLFDKVAFDVPNSKEYQTSLLKGRIEWLKGNQERKKKLLTKLEQEKREKDIYLAYVEGAINKSAEEFAFEVGIECNRFELQGLGDFSLQLGSGKIKVSWLTLKAPEFGKGILFHEMGHAISSQMKNNNLSEHSAKTYQSTRECLNLGFPSAGVKEEVVGYDSDKSLKYNVNMFVEENWGDLLSAKALGPEDKNFACLVIGKEGNTYTSNTLLPVSDKDPHAPELFRALRIEALRGKKLPAACQSLLTKDEQETVERDCWK